MNDEIEQLQKRLEQATSASSRGDGALDAETAALREGWLALEQLLEAVGPTFDEPLATACPPRRARSRWGLAAMITVAAALVVGATATWSLVGEEPVSAVTPPVEASKASATVVATNGLEWDDSLDKEIAAAGQQILRIQQESSGTDAALSPIYYRLRQIEQDLRESPL